MKLAAEERRRLRDRVRRGAFYLDEHRPGWHSKVNLERLDMSNGDRCVLGQLGTVSYYYALMDLFPDWTTERRNEWATTHGFVVLYDGSVTTVMPHFYYLRDRWTLEIESRRQ